METKEVGSKMNKGEIKEILQKTKHYWKVVGKTSSNKIMIEVHFGINNPKVDCWVGPFLWVINNMDDYDAKEHLETLLSWTMTALYENFDSWLETDGSEAFGQASNEDQDLDEYIRRLRESVNLRKLLRKVTCLPKKNKF